MKTITEFNGFTLKDALALHKQLTQESKTIEEITQNLGEKYKLEGDKLNWLLTSIESIQAKPNNIKRVLVSLLAEGEKAPSGAIQKENHCFAVEYYPAPFQKEAPAGRSDRRDGRDGKGKGRDGKGRGKGGKRDGERGAGGRPPRGPRPEGEAPTRPVLAAPKQPPALPVPRVIPPKAATPSEG